MITPKFLDDLDNTVDYKAIVHDIDESILQHHGRQAYEKAVLHRELSFDVREEIASWYNGAGWKHVYHRTSSEAFKRPGKTIFLLSMSRLGERDTRYFHETLY